jgi:hypothetical protein
MITVKELLTSECQSSPDGKHWEPALPQYISWRIRVRDAWSVLKGEATAICQTTKADIEDNHGIKENT